jgi:glycogen synthase
VARLLLLTPIELSRDPRARRAAAVAIERDFEVIGLCAQVSGEPPVPLEGVRIVRVGTPGRVDSGREAGVHAQRDSAVVRELRGLYRLGRVATRTVQLYRAGRRLPPPDVVHANDLDTLPAGFFLARRAHARLVYDAHELYAEFEPAPPRLFRAVMSAVEGLLARRAAAVVTVSDPLAVELQRRLRLRDRPVVVLNVPERDGGEPAPTAADGPLRAVYQGSFGPGRPLGELLQALALAPNVHLTIRAVRIPADVIRAEAAALGVADRVGIEPAVSPGEAVTALRGLEVGLIFDRPVTLNGELTLPNKLFEYLMAGLAVVVPDLPGLSPVVESEQVGTTFPPGRPEALAAALERLAADRDELDALRRRARRAALERFNAESQADTLARVWAVVG